MEPTSNPNAIIDFCLAPLNLVKGSETEAEARRRLTHVIRTFQSRVPQPVAIDFSKMPSLVINEAAHGYE